MKQLDKDDFSPLEEKPEWQRYAKEFDAGWAKLEEKRLGPMRTWAKTELAEANASPEEVLYPFAGPDFLTADTFFPKAKSYVFIGLEPPGDIPDLQRLSDKARGEYLSAGFNAIHNLLQQSYFITKEMNTELRSASFRGTTPVILMFMARMNIKVIRVTHISLDASGEMVEIDEQAAGKDPVLKKSKGVKIEFLPRGEEEPRTLYYFSVDLQDEKLKDNSGFVAYLRKMPSTTTYVKSASYLMHYLTFSMVRDACLQHSNFLLQDDSGIAYRFFDKKAWRMQLYGSYTSPISEFRKQYEKDLAKVYKDSSVKPLPFSLGYNTSRGGVNLLLATKRSPLS